MTSPETNKRLSGTKFLLASTAALSVLGAVVELALLLPQDGVGRVRDVGFLWLIRRVGFLLEIDVGGYLPWIWHQPFEIELGPVFQWFPLVLLTNVLLAWLVASVFYSIVRFVDRAFPKLSLKLRTYWLTRERYPLLIVIACALPTFIHAYELMSSELHVWTVGHSDRIHWIAVLFVVPNLLLLMVMRFIGADRPPGF